MLWKAEVHTNRERAATLLRAERRVQEREKWLQGEQQELDQTRDRVSPSHVYLLVGTRYHLFETSGCFNYILPATSNLCRWR